jgi:hypothetical protein
MLSFEASVGLGGEDSQSEEIKNEVSYQQTADRAGSKVPR